jgi:serine/threonine protein phosphatase PrpC
VFTVLQLTEETHGRFPWNHTHLCAWQSCTNHPFLPPIPRPRKITDHFLIGRPHTKVVDVKSIEEGLLVVASDGLWNVFEPAEVTNLVHRWHSRRGYTANQIASKLCKLAASHTYGDNVTCIVVHFGWAE